jgi:hypothetical protein
MRQCTLVSAGGEMQDIHIHVTHHNFPARSKYVSRAPHHLTKWKLCRGTVSSQLTFVYESMAVNIMQMLQ